MADREQLNQDLPVVLTLILLLVVRVLTANFIHLLPKVVVAVQVLEHQQLHSLEDQAVVADIVVALEQNPMDHQIKVLTADGLF